MLAIAIAALSNLELLTNLDCCPIDMDHFAKDVIQPSHQRFWVFRSGIARLC